MPSPGMIKLVRHYRSFGVDDREIWLQIKFSTRVTSEDAPWHHRQTCEWCGDRVLRRYLVPGNGIDGRMNWICFGCGCRRYGLEILDEMSQIE